MCATPMSYFFNNLFISVSVLYRIHVGIFAQFKVPSMASLQPSMSYLPLMDQQTP